MNRPAPPPIDRLAARLVHQRASRPIQLPAPIPVHVLALSLILLGTLAIAGPAASGTLDPELSARLATAGDTEQLPVLVVAREQADIATLATELDAARTPRGDRQSPVKQALKAPAARTRAVLEPLLAEHQARAGVAEVRYLWILNAVALRATPAVIEELARHPEVDRIFLDGVTAADFLVESEPANVAPGQAELGLRVVDAPALWGRGLSGAGILVANIDTGVDVTHPSLVDRWLGFEPGVTAADAWFDALNPPCAIPCDEWPHGTPTLGVVTGYAPATSDTVGAAVGAKWVAARTVGSSTSATLAAFEWAAEAPDGTRPPVDVINCSIRDPSIGQAGDCGPDGTYWQAVDAFEATGGAVVWAAGNTGPGAQTLDPPKNRITTPVNMFTVGNLQAHIAGFPINASSSRGPSTCDGVTPKPEVAAPGTSVRCPVPGGGYIVASGTSLAAPHAAGVIALLMEAFPWATGTEVKFALLMTAVDLGPPGDDNAYGMGLIDAGAAYDFLQGAAAVEDAWHAPESDEASLGQSVPNPFNPSTTIEYRVESDTRVTLRIYDVRGRVVRTLVRDEPRAPGTYAARWDGRLSSGASAPSGLYAFRLEVRTAGAAQSVTRKAILLR